MMGQHQSLLSMARSFRSTQELGDKIQITQSQQLLQQPRPWQNYGELEQALCGSCLEGRAAAVRALCGCCDVNAPALPWGAADQCMPPLLAALRSGSVETVAAVLMHPGMKVLEYRDASRRSFLHIVADEAGQWRIQPWKRPDGVLVSTVGGMTGMLLRHAESESCNHIPSTAAATDDRFPQWIAALDEQGRDALSIACFLGEEGLVTVLLEYGAVMPAARAGEEGLLHRLIRLRSPTVASCVELIATAEPERAPQDRGSEGETALHAAVADGNSRMALALAQASPPHPSFRCPGGEC